MAASKVQQKVEYWVGLKVSWRVVLMAVGLVALTAVALVVSKASSMVEPMVETRVAMMVALKDRKWAERLAAVSVASLVGTTDRLTVEKKADR